MRKHAAENNRPNVRHAAEHGKIRTHIPECIAEAVAANPSCVKSAASMARSQKVKNILAQVVLSTSTLATKLSKRNSQGDKGNHDPSTVVAKATGAQNDRVHPACDIDEFLQKKPFSIVARREGSGSPSADEGSWGSTGMGTGMGTNTANRSIAAHSAVFFCREPATFRSFETKLV